MGSGKRWKVATVRGIPLYVSTSWVFIVAFVVFILYDRYADGGIVDPVEALTVSVVATILFFVSVLVHEAAHAVMARGLDLPVMGITLVFWGGATEVKASARGAGGEFLVAFVGPASTLGDGGGLLGIVGGHERCRGRRRCDGWRSSACCSQASMRCRHSHSTEGGCSSPRCGASPATVGPPCAPPATSGSRSASSWPR